VRLVLRPRARRLALLLAMERGDRLCVRDVDEFLRDMEGCAAFYGRRSISLTPLNSLIAS
jgi:hypothetical protein